VTAKSSAPATTATTVGAIHRVSSLLLLLFTLSSVAIAVLFVSVDVDVDSVAIGGNVGGGSVVLVLVRTAGVALVVVLVVVRGQWSATLKSTVDRTNKSPDASFTSSSSGLVSMQSDMFKVYCALSSVVILVLLAHAALSIESRVQLFATVVIGASPHDHAEPFSFWVVVSTWLHGHCDIALAEAVPANTNTVLLLPSRTVTPSHSRPSCALGMLNPSVDLKSHIVQLDART
jgi:hypothetical protein